MKYQINIEIETDGLIDDSYVESLKDDFESMLEESYKADMLGWNIHPKRE